MCCLVVEAWPIYPLMLNFKLIPPVGHKQARMPDFLVGKTLASLESTLLEQKTPNSGTTIFCLKHQKTNFPNVLKPLGPAKDGPLGAVENRT